MTQTIAEHPFAFVGCWELREMLGRSARDERQLLEATEETPLDSIHYPAHRYFLRHKYIAGPYPNDFATGVAIQVPDRLRGEKLVQLLCGITGFTVNSVEGTAFQIHRLLDNPEVMTRRGEIAREYGRRNFLITRHLGDDLAVMNFWQ